MNIDIQKILPHRYPFLLVDRFISLEGDTFHCIKNVTHNEPFFVGHFPTEPVMPGVLIIEALAQAAAVGLAVREELTDDSALGYLTTVDKAKFRRKVVPGDRLDLIGEIVLFRRGMCKVEARAEVDGEVAAQALLTFMYDRS